MSSTDIAPTADNDRTVPIINSSPDSQLNPINKMNNLSEYQGDQIEEKRNNVFRIGFVNIHGIPKSHDNPKNSNIQATFMKYNFDYFGFAETNCYWRLAEDDDR